MPELFSQIGFVSAVLAGFAFTYVGGLLSTSSQSRAYAWVFGSALLSALSLMLAAVGSVFASLSVADGAAAGLRDLHRLISQAFLLGVLGMLGAAALSGWLHSRRLGAISTGIALLALGGFAAVLAPFVRFA